MSKWLRIALHPTPDLQRVDTSLRYTDILFGFVIRELFIRLANWPLLDTVTQLHLIAGTTLVLGSWIGFRRSLNRSSYDIKFFSLPLSRFLLDQMMLILYFRIAVLTPVTPGPTPPDANALAAATAQLLMYVFVLYVLWDILGVWMARTKKEDGKPRYPASKDQNMTEQAQSADWAGLSISASALAFIFVLPHFIADQPIRLLVAATVLLLAYRWVKEVRTTLKLEP
jgi:hypothetical protein